MITLSDTYPGLRRLGLGAARADLVGHLGSKAEFGLLLDLAGEERNGKKVLARGRLQRFYNGSLLYQIAEEVAARRASEWATLRGAVSRGIRELY
jgi:hypothetical protein